MCNSFRSFDRACHAQQLNARCVRLRVCDSVSPGVVPKPPRRGYAWGCVQSPLKLCLDRFVELLLLGAVCASLEALFFKM
ncbi:hypothetical protein T492DRAFT_891185 [Pavlovales sp. CCMP2436]|nr:hypothetical protein T492DRAFT_891185 [Pavlovales sp. CCMP2436]